MRSQLLRVVKAHRVRMRFQCAEGSPMHGWAQLKNNGGTIQLLDSALAYGADGIYAGTRTLITIPEPSTLLLSVAGALLLGFRRWRTSSTHSSTAEGRK